jgi:predicted alpha/beta superfamily hydrolase
LLYQTSEVHDFKSRINGDAYKLFIILPRSYKTNSAKRYPVFYVLDGNDTATIAWLTRSRQHSDASEIIFVGIGYPEPLAGPPVPLPGKPAVAPAQRSADYALYSATEPWSPPKDKGAPVFLKVVETEVIPYIDGHYRTDPKNRGLGGHSLGGLFATYAIFNASDTFQKFWIGSPSLRWDHSVLFKDEAEYAANHRDLDARVIADVGGQESKTFNRDPLFEMMDEVKSRHYPHLIWKTVVLANEDHGTLPIAGMPQVIDFLFGPAYHEPSLEERKAIAGKWRLRNGKIVHFTFEGDLLFATGLPFLGNTDPAKEQLITPIGADAFVLRTMLDLHTERGGAGVSRLLIHKMHSDDRTTATKISQ